MAVAFVTGKQTAGPAAHAELTITKPTSGNMLVAFISKSTEPTVAPKISDNGGEGEAGWTVNATGALAQASASGMFMATKKAKGTETELKATGGTVQGISYLEVSGSSEVIDTITATSNIAASKEGTTGAVSPCKATTDFLIVAAFGGSTTAETIEAWTGTGPVLTNVETLSTRIWSAWKVPAELVEGKTFITHHLKSIASGMLSVGFKVAAANFTAQCKAAATVKAKDAPIDEQQAQINLVGAGGVKGIVKLATNTSPQQVMQSPAKGTVVVVNKNTTAMIAQAKAQAKDTFATQTTSQTSIRAGVVAKYQFKDGAGIEVMSKVQALGKLIFHDVATPQAMMQAGARAKVVITAAATGHQESAAEGLTAQAKGMFRFATAASPQQIAQVAGNARLVFAGNATVHREPSEGGGTRRVSIFIFED